MKARTHYLWFNTKRRQEIIDITDEVAKQVETSEVREGFVLVSAMHISASVFVNDHESGLWEDILTWLEGTIAPWDPQRYRHNETGEDNAAAHLRSLTIGHEVIVPITAGKLDFGPWQRVFTGGWGRVHGERSDDGPDDRAQCHRRGIGYRVGGTQRLDGRPSLRSRHRCDHRMAGRRRPGTGR